MGMYVFSIYQNKVVQRHASLLDSREQISEKKTITINKPQGFSEIKIQQIGVHLEWIWFLENRSEVRNLNYWALLEF